MGRADALCLTMQQLAYMRQLSNPTWSKWPLELAPPSITCPAQLAEAHLGETYTYQTFQMLILCTRSSHTLLETHSKLFQILFGDVWPR